MTDQEKLNLIARICRSTKHLNQIKDILAVAESNFMDDAPERILRAFTVTGTQPEIEWACNRCMYAWDGQIMCPLCGHQATHEKAYATEPTFA